MRGSSKFLGLLLVFGLLLSATAAFAQLKARDNPKVSGPLRRESGRCARSSDTPGDQSVAVSSSCGDVYTFDPAREGDPRRNYGVVWLQTSVNPRDDFCATQVRSKISLPKRATIESFSPTRTRASRRRAVRARLVVDAHGTAATPGVIKNHFTLYPRGIKTLLNPSNRKIVLEWNGKTSKTLAFALGVEFSFPNRGLDAPPEGSLASHVSQRATC